MVIWKWKRTMQSSVVSVLRELKDSSGLKITEIQELNTQKL